MRKRILVAASDPGGASALVPVLQGLETIRKYELNVFAEGQAQRIFKKSGILYTSSHGNTMDFDSIENWSRSELTGKKYQAVVTGTSFYPGSEQGCIRMARELNIPCVTLIDSWSNYRQRFLRSHEMTLTSAILPTRIAVPDQFAVHEMEEAGFPEKILRIIGQPALDRFANQASLRGHEERKTLCSLLKISFTEPVFAFFSQPISNLYGPPDTPSYRGYTEYDVLEGLLKHVSLEFPSATLLVKLHPKEDSQKFKKLLNQYPNNVQVSELSEENLVLGADIVIGMTSIVLVKAYLCGKKVLSLQPNLRGVDQCVLSRMKLLQTFRNFEDLSRELRVTTETTLSLSTQTNVSHFLVDGKSVERMIAIIEEAIMDHEYAC